MSGPVTDLDADTVPAAGDPVGDIEIMESRSATVGAMAVRRALPQRGRRTVGAWCFFDHAGPVDAASGESGIGPHPHIGLQTVTWVLAGELVHRDSLGSEQPIRPGELNLMTAGRGIVHAEEHPVGGPVHIAQLWVAQPEATRNAPPEFEHHGELPRLDLGGGSTATVLVGEVGGARSSARRDSDHVGVDLELSSDVELPAERSFEYAVVPLEGVVQVEGRVAEPGHLVYLGLGRDEIRLRTPDRARAVLVGGVPFEEPILMWWNYVARTREEISAAHQEWTSRSERFTVPTSSLAPIDVDGPPWAPSD
ncbi:MAG TPA: pirin family protein [Acidimicrobiales bacterium]